MKKIYFLFIFSVILIACQNPAANDEAVDENLSETSFTLPDSLSARRISFVLQLREAVADRYWPDFRKKAVEGTFNYFNGDHSEIFFPSEQVLARLDSFTAFSDDYVLSPRTDSIPYHFELMISFNEADSTKIFFDNPVQQFLSVEETGEYITSVATTEMWSTMVIHEMFHHFQYNNPLFKEYAKSSIGKLPYDIRNLRKLCQDDDEFLKLIQKENDYLLEAIAEENTNKQTAIIQKYLTSRSERIAKYGADRQYLEQVENYYIIQEGSARYMEYQGMNILHEFGQQTDATEIKDDPRFNSYIEFEKIDFDMDEFSYLTYAGASDYHYALGFNLMRLLDKLGIGYKKTLFNNPEKPLHQYLE